MPDDKKQSTVITLLPSAEPHTCLKKVKQRTDCRPPAPWRETVLLGITSGSHADTKQKPREQSPTYFPIIQGLHRILGLFCQRLILSKEKNVHECEHRCAGIFAFILSNNRGQIVKEKNTYCRAQLTFFLFGGLDLVIPLWSFL